MNEWMSDEWMLTLKELSENAINWIADIRLSLPIHFRLNCAPQTFLGIVCIYIANQPINYSGLRRYS
jgi:hypothetical protein